jgi:hypothetical protein
MIGKHFDRWIVLKQVGRTKNRSIAWLCRCDCGTERIVDGSSLRSGRSRSCGCLQKDVLKDIMSSDRNPMKDIEMRKHFSQLFSGENNPMWNSNLTDEERIQRHEKRVTRTPEYNIWRKTIYNRDNYTCQRCYKRGGRLIAHHIFGWTAFPYKGITI